MAWVFSDGSGPNSVWFHRWEQAYGWYLSSTARPEAKLRQALEAAGFPLADLVEHGMGYKDGGEDVRGFRAAVLGDTVRPSLSLLLRAAMAEARVTSDPAGNRKLSKVTQGGRRARGGGRRRGCRYPGRRPRLPAVARRREEAPGLALPRSGVKARCQESELIRSSKNVVKRRYSDDDS